MKTSRWTMMLGALPLAAALAALGGCNAGTANDDETAAAAAPIEAAAETPSKGDEADGMRGRRGMHGMRGTHGMRGPGFLLHAALKELDLTDAQRATIQGELDALRDARGPKADKATFDAHRAALAAAVRSGKVDESALPSMPEPKGRDTARLAKAVEKLHATLTPDQRKQLVDAVSAKAGKGFGREGRFGKGGKHFRGGKMGRGMMEHVLHGIELTDAQREKVKEALDKLGPSEADREARKARHEAMAKTMKERLQAFAADSFDAQAFVARPADAPAFGPEMGPRKMVEALAVVVPILDESQRAELAKRIEQGPPEGKRFHGRRGMRGGRQ